MTTDITELAQREKFEAWARSQQLSIAYGDCGYVYSSTEMAWRAVKALSAELVEALEKAQTKAVEQGRTACELFDEVTTLRQRIAELEDAEQKLCAANVTLDARAELAERQLAELESRTVKLPPKIERNDADGWFVHKGGRVGGGAAEWYNKALDDVGAELTAAGIKVEAELCGEELTAAEAR
ncbi:hypothetical protein QCW82_003822 [Klebsiella michiganensis]|nr:hypothetical protein [Klebsiella michiganensis]